MGLVTNLARPTGNLTGFSILAGRLMPKRLALLSELVPQATVIALLINPDNAGNPANDPVMEEVREGARARGVRIVILTADTEGEIDTAFDTLVQQHAGAVLVGSDPFFDNRREQLVALASRHAVPALYEWREFAASGSAGPTADDVRVGDRHADREGAWPDCPSNAPGRRRRVD